MDIETFIKNNLRDSAQVKLDTIQNCSKQIVKAVELIIGSFRNRGKLLICGNGGSAADAQHLVAELVIRLSHDIQRPGLPAISLTTDTSVLTAGGNDIGFVNVFARQVEALGHPEDILLIISTSGNSENLIRAIRVANEKGLKRIGLLGCAGGKCGNLLDIPIIVPSDNTQRIQEAHITIGHILIELIERELYE